MFFDPDGNPLTATEWAALIEQKLDEPFPGSFRVGVSLFEEGGHPPVRVSTVWIGVDKTFGDETPPLIYETMVFGGNLNGEHEWYATREQAERGHSEWVKRVETDLGK